MTSTLNINDTNVLRNFRNTLSNFSEKTQENAAFIQTELQQTLEWIDDRVQHWRSEVNLATERVEDAMDDLRRCESESDHDDDDNTDCSYEEETLEETSRELEDFQENLETAERWRIILENAVEEYYRNMTGFHNLITDHTENAKALLSDKLDKYEIVHSPGNYIGNTINLTDNIQKQQTIALTEEDKTRIVSLALNFSHNDIMAKAEELRQGNQPNISTLTDSEIVAINSLTYLEYMHINPSLRGELSDKELSKKDVMLAEVISSGLKKLPDYNGIVRRRVNYTEQEIAEHESGKTVKYNSFTHCTYRKDKDIFPERNTLLIIQTKHGKKIEFMSIQPDEKEIIIDKETSFIVTKNESNNLGYTEIHLLEE